MSVHAHRRAAGIPRQSSPRRDFFYYGNEELIFDDRIEACRVEFDDSIPSKNRDNQLIIYFLNIKNPQVMTAFSGDEYAQIPITRLSLKEVKQRMKDYKQIGKDTSALYAAVQKCKSEYPTHRPRLS